MDFFYINAESRVADIYDIHLILTHATIKMIYILHHIY